jgi:hypothetical protein
VVLASYTVSLVYFLSILLLLVTLLRKKRYLNPSLLWVTFYVILAFFIFIFLAFIRSPGPTNLYITIYSLLEFLIMGELLDGLIIYKKKRLLKLLRWTYTLAVCVYIIINQEFYNDNMWVAEFSSLFLIFQSLLTMKIFLNKENTDHLKNLSFWLIISVFFLHIFSVPIVVYDYYLFNSFFIDSTLITRISNFSIYILFNTLLNISINRLC